MALTDATTSLQRTYQYLRIALTGTVLVLFVSVAVAVPLVGWLPSISHYFYTPARNGFVGALLAASVALFALSGRRSEPVLLDAAALVAPLIANVPTVIDAGSVPNVDDGCRTPCVPAMFMPDVNNGVITYLVVGTVAIIVAIALRGLRPGIWIAIGVLVLVGITWGFFFDAFLLSAHAVAATAFFALIAAFAVRSALPNDAEEYPPGPRLRVAYLTIAALLVIDLIVLIVLVFTGGSAGHGILIGEALALTLFATLWVLQTVQKWGQTNPSIAPFADR